MSIRNLIRSIALRVPGGRRLVNLLRTIRTLEQMQTQLQIVQQQLAQIQPSQHQLTGLAEAITFNRNNIQGLLSKLEISPEQWEAFQELRRSLPPLPADPLVSICVATYNRAQLLTERCLPSILNQTYRNLEVVVVSDGSTDHTAQAVAGLNDPRIRFFAQPRNVPRLDEGWRRWMTYGGPAMNRAMELSRGEIVTHLDDDDEYALDRIEKLLHAMRSENADLVYHPFEFEDPAGNWQRNEAPDLVVGSITTSAMFYRRWLTAIRWDINSHLVWEPGDWGRVRRFKYLGAHCVRYPEALLKHYRERTQHTSSKAA